MSTLSISLPYQIIKQVDSETKKHGFATRSEFIRALLRRYFSKNVEFDVFEPKPIDEIKLELAKTGKYSEKFIDSITKGLSKSSLYAR